MTYFIRRNTFLDRARRGLGKLIAGPMPPIMSVQGSENIVKEILMSLQERIRQEIDRCEQLANQHARNFVWKPERDENVIGQTDFRAEAIGYMTASEVLKGLLVAEVSEPEPPKSV